jgi:hypothetical protein
MHCSRANRALSGTYKALSDLLFGQKLGADTESDSRNDWPLAMAGTLSCFAGCSMSPHGVLLATTPNLALSNLFCPAGIVTAGL